MTPDPNTAFGPPPLQTPITADTPDQFGIPHQLRTELPATGRLNTPWAAWFNKLFEFLGTRNWVPYFPTTADLTATSFDATYSVAGKTVFVKIFVIGTGTGVGFVTLDLPVVPKGNQFLPAQAAVSGTQVPVWTIMSPTTNQVTVELFSGSFTAGQPVGIIVEGSYEAQ